MARGARGKPRSSWETPQRIGLAPPVAPESIGAVMPTAASSQNPTTTWCGRPRDPLPPTQSPSVARWHPPGRNAGLSSFFFLDGVCARHSASRSPSCCARSSKLRSSRPRGGTPVRCSPLGLPCALIVFWIPGTSLLPQSPRPPTSSRCPSDGCGF